MGSAVPPHGARRTERVTAVTTQQTPPPPQEQSPSDYPGGTPLAGALRMPLDQVVADPSQVRKDWGSATAQQALADLVASVRAYGILQPLLVRADPDAPPDAPRYIVIAGGRRREAALRAGLVTVPVVVRDTTSMQGRILQLTENLLRHDLTPLDEARAYRELMDLEGLSAEEVGRRLHISGQTVRNRLRVLEDQVVTDAIERGQISLSAGHLILQLPAEERLEFLTRLRAGEHLLTPGVIAARRQRLAAGETHPGRRGPGRALVKNSLNAPSAAAGHAPRAPIMFPQPDPAAPAMAGPSLSWPSVSPAAVSPRQVEGPTSAELTLAQMDRARVLADVLASVVWRGVRDVQQAETVAGLREVVASPHGAAWSYALLAEVVQRLDRSRY